MATHFDAIELLSRYETPLIKDMEADDDVLEWVAAFIGSDTFRTAVDAFCDAHGEKFTLLMAKGGPTPEQLAQVEASWKELHLLFIDSANEYIEEFLTARGFTMEQYNARCEEEMHLSEERQRHTRLSFFVQIIMACCEYDQFLNLMRRAADPEYYDKKELQYEAENIVYQATEAAAGNAEAVPDADKVANAQGFLEYFQANPDVSLDELTQEFQKRVKLA
uniref:Cilia- and flagella-associated protein 36 n=1 Tax=Globisporangium ultimum (strain ATCC 200006 / CBS 805.95 / DAOM BR144) TaxID=431595 RepID=K3WAC0_GLOUD